MSKDWSIIYSSNQLFEVEYIQSLLLEEDIESVIINRQDSSYIFGDIDLYVQATNVLQAKQLILDNENEQPD